MKKFTFTLGALATLRQRQEQQALEAYALALSARARCLEDLRAADLALVVGQRLWRDRAQNGCFGSELVQQARHCRELAGARAQRATALEQAEQRARTASDQMLEARRRRQVVSKIETRQKLAYDYACSREEQKSLDELAQRCGGSRIGLTSASIICHD